MTGAEGEPFRYYPCCGAPASRDHYHYSHCPGPCEPVAEVEKAEARPRYGHGWTPGKFGGWRVMLARYPCPSHQADHDPALPPEEINAFGYRRNPVSTTVQQVDALGHAAVDVLWQAQRCGETTDGDTAFYLLTKGTVHRLIHAAQSAGFPAAFRADDRAAQAGDTEGAGPEAKEKTGERVMRPGPDWRPPGANSTPDDHRLCEVWWDDDRHTEGAEQSDPLADDPDWPSEVAIALHADGSRGAPRATGTAPATGYLRIVLATTWHGGPYVDLDDSPDDEGDP